jgi:hypothetical protein
VRRSRAGPEDRASPGGVALARPFSRSWGRGRPDTRPRGGHRRPRRAGTGCPRHARRRAPARGQRCRAGPGRLDPPVAAPHAAGNGQPGQPRSRSVPPAGCLGCSSRSAPTSSASGRGKSRSCFAISTGSRSSPRTWPPWPDAPPVGPPTCSCSTWRHVRKSQAERRRVLASMAQRSRLVQEYLTRHVLAGLSADLQDFLIRTSVLRRPTVALCDELLGWPAGSREAFRRARTAPAVHRPRRRRQLPLPHRPVVVPRSPAGRDRGPDCGPRGAPAGGGPARARRV